MQEILVRNGLTSPYLMGPIYGNEYDICNRECTFNHLLDSLTKKFYLRVAYGQYIPLRLQLR